MIHSQNKFRRALSVLCAAALALALTAGAGAAVVNNALYTDIVAEIDGRPIRSYNIDGRTAVVAEDLRSYGFDVVWNPEDRSLTLSRNPDKPITAHYTPQALSYPVGTVSRAILKTDIRVYGESSLFTWESFNIGGETAVFFSDLSEFGAVSWDGAARRASLDLSGESRRKTLARLWREKVVEVGGSSASRDDGTGWSIFTTYTRQTPGGEVELEYVTGIFAVREDGSCTDVTKSLEDQGWRAAPETTITNQAFEHEKTVFSFDTTVTKDGEVHRVHVGVTLPAGVVSIAQMGEAESYQRALQELVQGFGDQHRIYEGQLGAVVYARYADHLRDIPVTASYLYLVKTDGETVELMGMLAQQGCAYVEPEKFAFAADGKTATFETPVHEKVDSTIGAPVGRAVVTVDLVNGTAVFQPQQIGS